MIACELCAYDERLRSQYATTNLFREYLELVHGIRLDEDGRAIKSEPPADDDPRPEPSISCQSRRP